VVTNDPDLAAKIRRLRDHGRTSKYVHEELGFGHRLDALQAAILAAKLPFLDAGNRARQRLARRYRRQLANCDLVLPYQPAFVQPVHHLFVVRLPRRDQVLQQLQAQGIGAGIHYPLPLHLQPAYRFLGYEPGSFPVAEAAAGQVLSLPIFPEMTDAQQDHVVATLKALMG
jgi:dTDP-4-amino-4,6-dideoxygalactose transaminase